MKLLVPVLLNILLAVGIYILKKKGKLDKLSKIQTQIIIGLCFGIVSAFASSYGVEVLGIVVNVRDASPIISGLVFGPISGIISGCIGGLYRFLSFVLWGAGEYTVIACSISTVVAGIASALLRVFMFDNKRPTVAYSVGIAVVLEVFHMLMIFITNFDDANTAFLFVRQCTALMIICNSLAVGLSVFVIALISNDFKLLKPKKEKGIVDTFQVWLFMSIIIAFIITSIFTYNLQTSINNKNIQEMFTVSVTDTATDIQEESHSYMLETLNIVKEEYLKDESIDLRKLLFNIDYIVSEINVVSKDGIITKSNIVTNINFDMRKTDQSNEFMVLTNQAEEKTFVQLYRRNGVGVYRKYAGVSLPDGGFLQIGYDAKQFHENINYFVVESIKHRHVGAEGFLLICEENLNIVSGGINNKNHISTLGITVNEEMKNQQQATKIHKDIIKNEERGYEEESIYVFAFVEGYCIIAVMPQDEAMLMRDASMYLSLFMQVLIFAVLFALIFYLIKKIIINNLHKVNQKLSEITGGNLDVTVDVRSSEEFSSLSDDINSTVSTLKRYIAEAAARIDKELEYAKQIQLAALPTNLTNSDDFEIYAAMIAAKEVGGDFYDFYRLDDEHFALLVADVSGKGIPAAMFMMTAKTIIKDLAESGMEVSDIFTKANQKLCENNESGMFVTAWMGILNINTGVLQYANAGHNPPLILNGNGEYEYLRTRAGFILGGMDGVIYKQSEITLNERGRIFLYTDGVTEATNENKQLYGEDRLIKFMNENKSIQTNEILQKIKENIDEFVGEAPQADDITMLIFDYIKQKEKVVTKTFKADDSELINVLGLLEEQLEKYECSLKTITAMCVAIEEVFVNVSHYAYGDGEGDCTVTIKFLEKTREFSVIMEDKGIPFNPLNMKDPDISLPAEDRKIGGLGIYIAKKTMDEIVYKYENDTNILIMKKII